MGKLLIALSMGVVVVVGLWGRNDWVLIASSVALVFVLLYQERRLERLDALEARYRAEQELDSAPPVEQAVEAPLQLEHHQTPDISR
jgi:hypothetical protein